MLKNDKDFIFRTNMRIKPRPNQSMIQSSKPTKKCKPTINTQWLPFSSSSSLQKSRNNEQAWPPISENSMLWYNSRATLYCHYFHHCFMHTISLEKRSSCGPLSLLLHHPPNSENGVSPMVRDAIIFSLHYCIILYRKTQWDFGLKRKL